MIHDGLTTASRSASRGELKSAEPELGIADAELLSRTACCRALSKNLPPCSSSSYAVQDITFRATTAILFERAGSAGLQVCHHHQHHLYTSSSGRPVGCMRTLLKQHLNTHNQHLRALGLQIIINRTCSSVSSARVRCSRSLLPLICCTSLSSSSSCSCRAPSGEMRAHPHAPGKRHQPACGSDIYPAATHRRA